MEIRTLSHLPGNSYKVNLFAILALLAILAAEWFTPYVTITPPCALLVVGFLALKLRPRVLFIWVLVYSSITIFMIYLDRVNWTPQSSGFRFAIRIIGLVVGNGVAIGLSIYRTKLEDSYLQVLDIFQKIPAALIVSDSIGNVVTVNEETTRLCKLTATEMIGDSYFKFFGIGRSKGDSIKKYLDLVQNTARDTQIQEILLISQNRYIRGSLIPLRLAAHGEEKWILTTLQRSEESFGANK